MNKFNHNKITQPKSTTITNCHNHYYNKQLIKSNLEDILLSNGVSVEITNFTFKKDCNYLINCNLTIQYIFNIKLDSIQYILGENSNIFFGDIDSKTVKTGDIFTNNFTWLITHTDDLENIKLYINSIFLKGSFKLIANLSNIIITKL